jgi:hypothetical protein
MSDTPETQEAVERWRQGKINIFDEMARLERERDQARRELDVQLESIKFHMERVPVRDHPLRADDAKLEMTQKEAND